MAELDRAQLAKELAQSYYEAALAAADMRQVAQTLETLRAAFPGALEDLDAWREVEDAIGRTEEQDQVDLLVALRDRIAEGIARTWLEAVAQAFRTGNDMGRQTLRARCATALCRGHVGLSERILAAEYPGLAEDDAERASLREMVRYARVEAWPQAMCQIEALANDEALQTRERSHLFVMLGEVELYFFSRPVAALRYFDRAVALAPDFSVALMGMGEYWLTVGDLHQARAALDRAAAADRRNSDPCYFIGDCLEKEDKLESALEWYHEGLRRQPGSAAGCIRLLRQWGRGIQIGQQSLLLEALVRKAAQVDPESAYWVYREAGYACQERDQLDQAHRWFRLSTEANAENPNGYVAAAYLHIAQQDYIAALNMADQAVAVAPFAPEGHIALARIHEDNQRWASAEGEYRQAAERKRGGEGYFIAKAAQMAWEDGRREQAIGELLATLKSNPGDEAILGVVERVPDEVQRKAGDAAGALAMLDEIHRIVGYGYEARYHNRRGDLQHAAGDFAGAAQSYRAAIDADPRHALYYCNLCRAWRAQGQAGEAAALWSSAPQEVRGDSNFRSWIGTLLNEHAVALHNAEQYAEAVPWYRQSCEVFGDDAVAHSNLALALEAADDAVAPMRARVDEALEALRRASALAPGNEDYSRRRLHLEVKQNAIILYGERVATRRWAITPVLLEVARNLVPLVEGEGDALSPPMKALIDAMRQRLHDRYGVGIPGVRVRGNNDWPGGEYLIRIMGSTVATGRLGLDARLSQATAEQLEAIGVRAEQACEPASGAQAWWIAAADWQKLADVQLPLWETMEYPVRHMESLLARQLEDFVGCQEVVTLMEEQCEDLLAPVRACPNGIVALTSVLRALVGERASILPLRALCLRYLALAGDGADGNRIIESLRSVPELRKQLAGIDAPRRIALDQKLEKLLRNEVRRDDGLPYLALRPEVCQQAVEAIRMAAGEGRDAVLTVGDAALRPFVRRLVEIVLPDLPVLAVGELPDPGPVDQIAETEHGHD